MSAQFLERNDDFNVPTDEAVHSGKVRSVYWLKPEDSRRLIEERTNVCGARSSPAEPYTHRGA